MNAFGELLAKALRDCSTVSVYTDRSEPDRFAAGFVAAVSEDYVILKHVTPTGRYDGYVLRRMDDVYRIDTGGDYENGLAALYRLQKQSHPPLVSGTDSGDLLEVLLQAAQERGWPASVFINGEGGTADIIGFVREIGEETVTIEGLGPASKSDGMSLIAIACLSGLAADSEEERAVAALSDPPPK